MPTLSYNTGTFRYDPSSQIALMEARQRIWEEEQRRKRQTAQDILKPIQQKIRQRKEERERDRRQQMEQDLWQYRFDQESQRRQQELEFRYPALAEIQRIDRRLGDIERAKTDLMSRDIYGPVMTGMPGDMVNNSTIRDTGLKALEQEEAALRQRREELMGTSGMYGNGMSAGALSRINSTTNQEASQLGITRPEDIAAIKAARSGMGDGQPRRTRGFVLIDKKTGRQTPITVDAVHGMVTGQVDSKGNPVTWIVDTDGTAESPTQKIVGRNYEVDANGNVVEVPETPVPEQQVNDPYIKGVNPALDWQRWLNDKVPGMAWLDSALGGTGQGVAPPTAVDGASEATLTPKQEWIGAIAATGDPAEFDALDRVYSMVMEQGLSVDDPRVSPIIDALPEATQRNLARSLAAHGKL
jgi:hypothetical protein